MQAIATTGATTGATVTTITAEVIRYTAATTGATATATTITAEVIGYTAGFLTTVCLVPQLWKIVRTRSTGDISIATFLVLLCGQTLWMVYGVLMNDLRVIVPNVVSVVLSLLVIGLTVYFGK